jgi:aspartate aminotransferase
MAQNLTASPTMTTTLKAQELKAKGEDIILASVGEPDGDVEREIKLALTTQLMSEISRYGSAQGLLSTRQAISYWFQKVYQASYRPEQILITPGSKFGLYALMQILCDAGDEVLIPAPYWVSYQQLAEMARASVRVLPPNSEYKLSPDVLKRNLNEKSRVLMLNSPNNPSGAVYSKTELQELASVLKDHPDVMVICDDIYNQLNFDEASRAPSLLDVVDESLKSRLIIVHGVSKSYAMTGWRMGWIAAHPECIRKLNQFFSQSLTCTPDFIQKATEKALAAGDQFVRDLKKKMKDRHQWIKGELQQIPNIEVYASEGAFYLWLRLKDASRTSVQVAEELLQKKGIACMPGEAFGMPLHLRLSITLSDADLQKLSKRLSEYFAEKPRCSGDAA